MIYATHQANAYSNPEQLDEAIVSRVGNFLRCTWNGGSIVTVVENIKNDVTMSGRFAFIDRGENFVVVEDAQTGIKYAIHANGYVC